MDARIMLQLRNLAGADITAKLAKIAELQRGITLLDKQCEVDAARARLRVYDKSYTVPIPYFEDVEDSLILAGRNGSYLTWLATS